MATWTRFTHTLILSHPTRPHVKYQYYFEPPFFKGLFDLHWKLYVRKYEAARVRGSSDFTSIARPVLLKNPNVDKYSWLRSSNRAGGTLPGSRKPGMAMAPLSLLSVIFHCFSQTGSASEVGHQTKVDQESGYYLASENKSDKAWRLRADMKKAKTIKQKKKQFLFLLCSSVPSIPMMHDALLSCDKNIQDFSWS